MNKWPRVIARSGRASCGWKSIPARVPHPAQLGEVGKAEAASRRAIVILESLPAAIFAIARVPAATDRMLLPAGIPAERTREGKNFTAGHYDRRGSGSGSSGEPATLVFTWHEPKLFR